MAVVVCGGCANVKQRSHDGGADASSPGDGVAAPYDAAKKTDAIVGIGGPPGSGQMSAPVVTCADAKAAPGNAGCLFFSVNAVVSDPDSDSPAHKNCLVMFVVNPGKEAIKLQLHDGPTRVSLGQVARLPRGAGRSLTYAPFDETTGIPPGDVALLFLWDPGIPGKTPSDPPQRGCPEGIDAASVGARPGGPDSGVGNAFRLDSERPVVAYQIHPYSGGTSYFTSATMLIPVEAWGRHHFVPTPTDTGMVGSFAIAVASESDTTVTFTPSRVSTMAGDRVTAARAGAPVQVTLNAGEFVRFTATPPSASGVQPGTPGLGGSPITANKPIGVFGGAQCFWEPGPETLACDSAHQQALPLSALGYYYAAVGHLQRWKDESHMYQAIGAVDGTLLTYEPYRPLDAPYKLKAGQVLKFRTTELGRDSRGWPEKPTGPSVPFIVRSQDAQHPFYLSELMTGAVEQPDEPGLGRNFCDDCPGDPEIVNVIPVEQYMTDYTFFTDPSYPETNLTIIRRKGADGQFADVTLECASAPLSGWKPLGELEYTHLGLVTGDFELVNPPCNNGRHHISSSAPFGVTIWGWGRWFGPPEEPPGASFTSYAYPAGSAIRRLNELVVP